MQARKFEQAVALLARHGWWDRMQALVRQLDRNNPGDAKLLAVCANHLRKAGQFTAAKEALLRVDDSKVGIYTWTSLYTLNQAPVCHVLSYVHLHLCLMVGHIDLDGSADMESVPMCMSGVYFTGLNNCH